MMVHFVSGGISVRDKLQGQKIDENTLEMHKIKYSTVHLFGEGS